MRSRERDFYSRKAHQEHYRARSVYKLEEIHRKYRVFRRGSRVLDLGCAPGSWVQFSLKTVGPKGRVVGVDISTTPPFPEDNFLFISADVFTWDPAGHFPPLSPFNAVLSDMAPATTGVKIVDRENSYQLSIRALELAGQLLKPGGSFVCKIFQGEDWDNFAKDVKMRFNRTSIFKPRASRKESVEIYIIALGACRT